MMTPALKSTFKTHEYNLWEATLDDETKAIIAGRVKKLQMGLRGDSESVGEGVNELRFLQTGPGWRVYYHETDGILLLLGGNKSTQKSDIKAAKQILKHLKQKKADANKAKEQKVKSASKPTGGKR